MAAKKGDGLLMVYCDVAAEHEEEFNRWYNEEHIPERLAIPGVLNAARYKAVDGGPNYLACYELASPDAWYAEAWQQWLKHPTAWSKRMSPSVIGTTYIRNLYRRIYPKIFPRRPRRRRCHRSSWSDGCPSRRSWRRSSTTRTTTSACPCAGAFRATSVPDVSRR